MRSRWLFCLMVLAPSLCAGQGFTRYTYHDADKKNIKEVYQVKDTISNTLNGRYVSYFLNGAVESRGQFVNHETTGVWEFYYETGNLKMRGILRQNSNYGLWEYFYENGQKSMEGNINEKNKEGEWKIYYESGDLKEMGEYKANKRSGFWKTFFEDGTLRGEIDYTDDRGRYTEYYHSGKVLAEGPRIGARNAGRWRYYAEDGVLEGEGDFVNGKKNGDWKYYYTSGKVSSDGKYENDEPVGKWNYYFEDGTVSSSGTYAGGKKNGYWNSYNKAGTLKSEITYVNGSGEYKEYYPSGKLRAKGPIEDGKSNGKWQYFFEDGKLEGECDFAKGRGTYVGFYPNGTLQTKGQIEDDLRVGTWELYEQDGKLAGYYKPFYENNSLANEIGTLLNQPPVAKPPVQKAQAPAIKKRGFTYFKPRNPEYHGVILGGNPMMSFLGSFPVSVEFYNQERIGHEFVFEGIRNPFFTADSQVPQNKTFNRGYAIAVRQKFYNTLKTGMWYFGHELRFTNLGYFSNISLLQPATIITASASEQRAEYGVLLGSRLMQRNRGDGFTIDAFVGYAVGYRMFDVDPFYAEVFSNLNQNKFSQTFHFGLNFGYSMSFDGRRR